MGKLCTPFKMSYYQRPSYTGGAPPPGSYLGGPQSQAANGGVAPASGSSGSTGLSSFFAPSMPSSVHPPPSGQGQGQGAPPWQAPGSRDSWRALEEEVKGLILTQLEEELSGRRFSAGEAQNDARAVAERVLIVLRDVAPKHKLMVNCSLLQKGTGPLVSVSSMLVDPSTDGSTVVMWENDSMICTITVYATRI